MTFATLEISKSMKSKVVGRLEVRSPQDGHSRHYGIYYFIGPLARGFVPVPVDVGRTLAIGRAKELALPFAKQHDCKWVRLQYQEDEDTICTEWIPV